MKKRYIIIMGVIISIFIFFNVIVQPKNYLKYVFYNLEKGNYNVVSDLSDLDKNNIVNIYKFCEENNLSKPLKFIRKEDNYNYYVMLLIFIYGNDEDDYGKVLGEYTIGLNIKVEKNH